MKRWRGMTAVAVAIAVIWSMAALAQTQTTPAGCDPARIPRTVEGQVVKVDRDQGKVTVRGVDGTTHEFQASSETLQALKTGSPIELKLRQAPSHC